MCGLLAIVQNPGLLSKLILELFERSVESVHSQ
jgi:hypothetical protein